MSFKTECKCDCCNKDLNADGLRSDLYCMDCVKKQDAERSELQAQLAAAAKRAREAEARIKRHKELWSKAERKARELNDVVRADEDFIRVLPENLRLVQMATPTAYQFLLNCAAHEIEQLRARAQAVAEVLKVFPSLLRDAPIVRTMDGHPSCGYCSGRACLGRIEHRDTCPVALGKAANAKLAALDKEPTT